MMHLVSLDPLQEITVDQIRSRLYLAFASGCEHAGAHPDPSPRRGGTFDVRELLSAPPPFESHSDDRLLYLTGAPLTPQEGPLGAPPIFGFASLDLGRAVVTSAGLFMPEAGTDPEDEAYATLGEQIGRRAVQQMGFLWGLRRCVDPRCAMAIPWLEGQTREDASLCEFCRDRSEILLSRVRS